MKKAIPFILTVSSSLFAGQFDAAVRAFENAPDYVAPIATILGTSGSCGWNNQSSIGKSFSGSVSIPVNFVVISDNDRSYSGTYIDSALFKSSLPQAEIQNRAYINYTTPTIFGKQAAPTLQTVLLDVDGNVNGSTPVYFSDGIENLAAFNWLPIPTIQADFSMYNTSLKIRYIGVPTKELGVYFPGIGIQHDLRSVLPTLPVNLTLFGNFSRPMLNWTPGDNIDGTLKIRGFSAFTGCTVGKSMLRGMFDVLLEAGWEHSTLKTGGSLDIHSIDNSGKESTESVTSDMKLTGSNKFRAGVTVAFNPGRHYRASGGVTAGAEQSFTANILALRFGNSVDTRRKQITPEPTQQEQPAVNNVPETETISAVTPSTANIINQTNITLPSEE